MLSVTAAYPDSMAGGEAASSVPLVARMSGDLLTALSAKVKEGDVFVEGTVRNMLISILPISFPPLSCRGVEVVSAHATCPHTVASNPMVSATQVAVATRGGLIVRFGEGGSGFVPAGQLDPSRLLVRTANAALCAPSAPHSSISRRHRLCASLDLPHATCRKGRSCSCRGMSIPCFSRWVAAARKICLPRCASESLQSRLTADCSEPISIRS